MVILLKVVFTVSIIIVSALLACTHSSETSNKQENTIELLTEILDESGNEIVVDTIRVWFYDSIAIQEMHVVKRITDTDNISRFEYRNIGFRVIILRENRWFDLRTLTDTAVVQQQGLLPEKKFKDLGWVFYSKLSRMIDGKPTYLGDTLIGNEKFKKFQFNLTGDNKIRTYRIGLLNCTKKDILFSLEKILSDSIGCTMTRLLTYLNGQQLPIASYEVKYIADSIPKSVKEAMLNHSRK